MAWNETNIQEEKLLFIADWLREEYSFKTLCERYGISRKTGYILVDRFEAEGNDAFKERSHSRHYHPNELSQEMKRHLVDLKYRYPLWGPAKIRDWMEKEEPWLKLPAASTIGELFKKYGLVKARKYRKKVPAQSSPFSLCNAPNDVWSADFKGQFKMGNGLYCYPLTISDNESRYLLGCDGLLSPNLKDTISCFERVFKTYGLPKAIRTDNGQPFAGTALGGLTALSIWWLKLGILPERIAPGRPQQNGRHERMHRTLKEATAKPAQGNAKEQQKSFDAFRQEYNEQRPHQALNKKRPGEIYEKSVREYPNRLSEVTYPDHFLIRKVRTSGDLKWCGKRYYVSELLYSEPLGLEPIDDGRAILYFAGLKLGLIDARQDKITRL